MSLLSSSGSGDGLASIPVGRAMQLHKPLQRAAAWRPPLIAPTVGQTKMSELVLRVALPAFALELEQSLREQGRADLASQVATLPLVDRCRCEDDFCATF